MTNLEQALDSLTRARDTMRLELHLLSMDARNEWEPPSRARSSRSKEKVGAQAEIASEASAGVAAELSDSVKEFVDAHVRIIHR